MKQKHFMSNTLVGAAGAMVVLAITTVATATEPCNDEDGLGECKALIEINATDGDIGFHFLMDGDDLIKSEVNNPDGQKIFEAIAKKEEREQFMTETFVESAEPLCWPDPEAAAEAEAEGEELEIVTLEDFLELWTPGTYEFVGRGKEGEMVSGETELTYLIPAAPANVAFNTGTNVISWAAGIDLGNCADFGELTALVESDVLPLHPSAVMVDAWEVVFEPDVEDGDPLGQLKFTIRLSGDVTVFSPLAVTVPQEYIDSIPDDTLAKIEVGAIGGEDNATFTEIFNICVNLVEGCEEED
ncbi:MAG: hypothetical protein IH930_06525 [Proteobacteria bacterium]|nr:hypothetical protein [Pseudomonadota bacterium]